MHSELDFSLQLSKLEPSLRVFTKRFTSDRDESFDLIQDTLLRALKYRDKFQDGTNLRGWLFTIMRNTFINQYRKTRRHKTISINNELLFINVEETHTFNRPDVNLEYDDVCRKISDVREELLTPFEMHTKGYKYTEIANQLKIPIGTVKNRIFHARKEIQSRLIDTTKVSQSE